MKKTKIFMLALAALSFTVMSCSFMNAAKDAVESQVGNGSQNNGGNDPEPTYQVFVGTDLCDAGSKTFNDVTYKIVKFGDMPQTIKGNDVRIDKSIAAKAGDYTYFKGSDGAWYCECPEKAYLSNYEGKIKYTNGELVSAAGDNKTKWFKVEPIEWYVISESSDNGENKSLLLAKSVLINCAFYDYSEVERTINNKTIYATNYDHSRVRAYLNGISYVKQETDDSELVTDETFVNKGFLQAAFTDTLKSKIFTTTVVTDSENANYDTWTGMESEFASNTSTEDKIFLLSELEATKYDYGFFPTMWTNNEALIRYATDFAKANGVSVSNSKDDDSTEWWLRTPTSLLGASNASCVMEDSILYRRVDSRCSGVVPAIWIQK